MNLEKIFKAVIETPDESSLLMVVLELENQGYQVFINNEYNGSEGLTQAEESGELDWNDFFQGANLSVKNNSESQTFKIQFLDDDAICFTAIDSLPVIYNPDLTTGNTPSFGQN